MNCAFDKERLTGYFDGELEAAEKVEVEKHISACSECLRDLGEIKSAAQMVKALPRLRAPSSVAEAVAREVSSAGRVHSFARYRKPILWTFAAAAALLIVANIAYFTSSGGDSAPVAGATKAPAAGDLGHIGVLKESAGSYAEGRKDLSNRDGEKEGGELRRRQVSEKADKPGKAENEKAPRSAPKPESAFGAKLDAEDGKLGAGKGQDSLKKQENKESENRALAQGGAKPAEAPAPAAAAPVPQRKTNVEELAKKSDEKAAAPPSAPPAPGKAPATEPGEALALKDAAPKSGADLQKQKQEEGRATSLQWTCAASRPSAARAKAEEYLTKKGWMSPVASNAPAAKKAASARAEQDRAGDPPQPLTVELTAAQFAELKKTLEAQEGMILVAGTPEESIRAGQQMRGGAGAPRVGGGLAGGKAGEDPAKPEGQSKGAPYDSGNSGEAKRSKPAASVQEEPKEREAAEKAKEQAADKAPTGGRTAEPRQKYVLYFLEAPADKK